MNTNTPTAYNPGAKFLHWLIALLMPAMIAVGSYMATLSDEDLFYYRLLDLHQTTGLFIFIVFFIKIAWRIISPYPNLAENLSRWECWMAHLVHKTLFAALAILPVLGYLFATAQGDEIPIYGLMDVPALVALTKAQSETVITLHMTLAYGSAALIALHVLAVIKHRFVDNADVLKRMW